MFKLFKRLLVTASLLMPLAFGQSYTIPNTASSPTWTGHHTFIQSPTIPLPTLGTDAANKEYVDNSVSGGTSYPQVIRADLQAGVDWCAKVAAAQVLLPAGGGTIDARGLDGDQVCSTRINFTKAVNLWVSRGTLTFTGSDQGQSAGVFNVQVSNFAIIVEGATGSWTIKRGTGTNIQTLIWLSGGISDIYFFNFKFDENAAGQTLPELTNFYTGIKSDPTNGGVTNITFDGFEDVNGLDRPVDLRASHNVFARNVYVHNCGIENPNRNFGCEAWSVDAGGRYLNTIGYTIVPNGASGTGYPTSGTSVAFSSPGGGGIQATGTAIVHNGVLVNPVLTANGNNYVSPPLVQVTGDGFGAQFTAPISGHVTGLIVNSGGTGYTHATVTFPKAAGVGATLGIAVSGGGVSACNVNSGGTNYDPKYTTVQFNDLTGNGAFATLVLVNGVVTACNIVNPGANYTNSATASVVELGGSGGSCTGVITSGAVSGCTSFVGGNGYLSVVPGVVTGDGTGADVTGVVMFSVSGITEVSGGFGYTTAAITFVGGGGTGATATVSIANGVLTAVTMTNVGTQYFLTGAVPTCTVTGTGGSGGLCFPQQGAELNSPTATFVSDSEFDNYSDSVACGRGSDCHFTNVTLKGIPYFGGIPRATAGGLDFGGCTYCSVNGVHVLGANGPQLDFVTLALVGINFNVSNVSVANSIFDPTAVGPGVTPVTISQFDQVFEFGADFQGTTCDTVNLSNNIFIGTRLLIENCQNVNIQGGSLSEINPVNGTNFAIDLRQLDFVSQPTQAIQIQNVNFRSPNHTIVYAVNYNANLLGGFPYLQEGNQYQNGIQPYIAQGFAVSPSLDIQLMKQKAVTLYGSDSTLPYGPEFIIRTANGTQGIPTAVTAGQFLGRFSFRPYSSQGQGLDHSGYIYACGIAAQALGNPSGGVLSAAIETQTQDPLGSGLCVNAFVAEPGINISYNPIDFFNVTGTGYGQISAAALQSSDAWTYALPRKNGVFAMTSDLPSKGRTSLVGGTQTVSSSAAATLGNYILTNCAPSGTAIGVLTIGTIVPGTSFVINSISSTNTLVTGDTSTVCWAIQ